MKSLLRAALAIAMVAMFSMATESNADAQNVTTSYNAGYGAGLGFNFSNNTGTHFGNTRGINRRFARRANGGCGVNGFGFPFLIGGGLLERSEDLPYFAKFPPVYYSGKVTRPYGISPFAAPPGIAPVEMNAAPVAPQKVINPYFKDEMEVDVEQKVEKITVGTELKDKSTTILNPYIGLQANN